MRIHLLSVGTRMPSWVTAGYTEYAGRMPPECRLCLREIPQAALGRKADPARRKAEEGRRLLEAVPKGCRVVALDPGGRSWDSPGLSRRLGDWLAGGRDLALLVGGPEGLAEACLERADERWSLSPLTFPHPLVRVILAEQLYRAWAILRGHPYHRP